VARVTQEIVVELGSSGASAPVDLQVSLPRRALRNGTLSAGVITTASGCQAAAHRQVEGQPGWQHELLSGPGPSFSSTLAISAQHRPALLVYFTVEGCGTRSHGSAAEPLRVVIL